MAKIAPDVLFRLLQGHPTPKKSKSIVLNDSNPDPIYWLKRTTLKKALRAVAARKRFKPKHPYPSSGSVPTLRAYRSVQPAPCFRRFLEFEGLPAKSFDYTASPRLIAGSQPKIVYELQVAYLPTVSFTDAAEAQANLLSLQANGYGTAQLVRIDRSVPL